METVANPILAKQQRNKNMQPSYNYQQVLTNSERVNWRVEDIIGGSKRLDFDRPFVPESLARVKPLTFLNPKE